MLLFRALTCGEISIKRTYNTRTATEDLEILIDGFENELIKGLGDEKMRGEENFIRDYLLPIEIAKFFFFDAEKIVSLAEVNTPEQRKKLSRAYSEILGIKKYEDAKAEIEETQLRIRARTANAKEKETINNLDNDIINLRLVIGDNNQQIIEHKDHRTELKYESDEIQNKLIRVGNMITLEELEVLRASGSDSEARLNKIQTELSRSYELVPFAIAANKLGEVASQVKIEAEFKEVKFRQEDAANVEDKLLDELGEEIAQCGKVINESIRDFYNKTFLKLIRRHLAVEGPTFPEDFQLLHDMTESERAQLQTHLSNLRLAFQQEFKRLHFEYNQTRNDLAQIKRRIADAESLSEDAVVKADRKAQTGRGRRN